MLHQPDVTAVNPVEMAQGYNLEDGDPDIYRDGEDVDNFMPRESGQIKIYQSDLLNRHPLKVLPRMRLCTHFSKLTNYEQSRVENVLARVRSGAKDCTICGK